MTAADDGLPARDGPAEAAPGAVRRRRERKAVLLRLDPELHDALAKWAADDLRSTNAHIEWLLRSAVTEADRLRASRPREDSPGDDPAV